ncbi:MAG: sporulation protein YunB [Ruthenibacterium sp.]
MHHAKRVGFSKKTVRIVQIILLVLLVIAGFSILDARIRPVITTMAQYQCRVVSVLAMNEAIIAELEQRTTLTEPILSVEKDANGNVTSIMVDSSGLNHLKAQMTEAVSNRLLAIKKQDVHIPLGTLLGWQIMAGRGPNIHLQVLPASFVETSMVDQVETAGINQTQYRIFIRFTVQMSAILPGYSTSVTVENEICVAETLIVGQVPQVYSVRK